MVTWEGVRRSALRERAVPALPEERGASHLRGNDVPAGDGGDDAPIADRLLGVQPPQRLA